MKTKFLFVALMAALATSFTAVAADAPAKDAAAATEQPAKAELAKSETAKKKVKPHSHVEAKGHMVMDQPADAKEQPKRPPHDHLKEK